jgi:hypothetical protein
MCELRSSRAGVEEITYYTALANLLDEVGKTLKPKVRSVLQLKNCDWEPETKLLDEKRSEYFPLVRPDNLWLTAVQ